MESCFAASFFFFNHALASYLNFSTSSVEESLVEFVVVAPRTQGLLSMCPAGIMVQLMNTVLICYGLCSDKFNSLSEGGRELMPGMQIFH